MHVKLNMKLPSAHSWSYICQICFFTYSESEREFWFKFYILYIYCTAVLWSKTFKKLQITNLHVFNTDLGNTCRYNSLTWRLHKKGHLGKAWTWHTFTVCVCVNVCVRTHMWVYVFGRDLASCATAAQMVFVFWERGGCMCVRLWVVVDMGGGCCGMICKK